MTATVTDIQIDREHCVTVSFDDGIEHRFALAELRAACPCAACRSWRDRGEDAWPRPGQPATVTIADAELVGAWGISFRWSDGHGTGIYPWDALHRWARGDHVGQVASDAAGATDAPQAGPEGEVSP